MINISNIANEIIKYQKNRRLIFFIGAGISKDSFLPLGGELQLELIKIIFKRYEETIFRDSKNREFLKTSIVKNIKKLRLEQVLEAIFENCKEANDLLNIFRVKNPNKYHFFLSKLAKTYGPMIIITTNFDTLIEEAMIRDEVKFKTISDEVGLIYFCQELKNEYLNQTCILKLHGTISRPSTIRATLKNVGDRYISIALNELFKNLIKKYSFIILGYSANDDFDINQVLCNLTSKNKIYFISHNPKSYKVSHLTYPFENFNGNKIYYDTNKFIQRLIKYFKIKVEMVKLTQKGKNWRDILKEWYKKLDNFEVSSTIANLLYEVYDLEGAELFFKKSLKIANNKKNLDGIARAYNNIGAVYYQARKYDKAKKCYLKVIELTEISKINFPDYPIVLTNLSQIYLSNGKLKESFKFAEKSIKSIGRSKRNKIHKILAYRNIANLHFRLGNYSSAIRFCKKALEFSTEYGDIKTVSQIFCTLGNIFYVSGDINNAYKFYAKDLEISEKLYQNLKNHNALCESYINIGATLSDLGSFRDAKEYLEKAKRIAIKNKRKDKEARSLNNLGLLQYRKKYFSSAKRYFLKSLKLYQEVRDKKGTISTYKNLIALCIDQSENNEALKLLPKARNIAISLDEKYEIAEINGLTGLLNLKLNKFDYSEKYLSQALKLYEEMGNMDRIASTLINLGVVYNQQQRWKEAIKVNKKSLVIKEKFGQRKAIALVQLKLGYFYLKDNNPKKALESFKVALPFYESLNEKNYLISIYSAISDTYKQLGQNKQYSKFRRKLNYLTGEKELKNKKYSKSKNRV